VLSVSLSTVNSTRAIVWRECEPHPILSSEIQCGKVSVPINWDEPEGASFDLEVMRLPRRNDSTAVRLGSLFINPGGPGSSTAWTLTDIAGGYPTGAELKASFDIIGLDPRGVGLNAPSNCSAAISNEQVSLLPKTNAEYDQMVDKYKRLGKSCVERIGVIANYFDTISAAKDHEAVQLALDGEDMNWLGLSYGSQLGAQYAQLFFPGNIRTMVLDSIVQHSLSEASNVLIKTSAYAAELQYFFRWARENDRSVLKGQDVEQIWNALLKNATEAPLPTGGCKGLCHENVTADEIRINAQRLVASSDYFAQILKQATKGSATVFASPKYNVNDEIENFDDHSAVYAGLAIGCQD
jgi:pimeloyl-ACP methyl ester carboxylesterase